MQMSRLELAGRISLAFTTLGGVALLLGLILVSVHAK